MTWNWLPLVQSSKPRPDGTPRLRPASTATVRVAEFGLIPLRPAGTDFADPAYLPPERAADGTPTPAGDVFMLGGCLHYLLTARPPGSSPLAVVRPDTPPELVVLYEEMTAADPNGRPSVATVLTRLDAISAPAPTPAPPTPVPAEASSILTDAPTNPLGEVRSLEVLEGESDVVLEDPAPADVEPVSLSSGVDVIPSPSPGGWAAYTPPVPASPMQSFGEPSEWSPQPFVPSEFGESRSAPGYDPIADGVSVRRTPRPPAPGSKQKLWMWLGIGVALQIVAVILWVILFTGGSEPDPEPREKPLKRVAPR